MDCHKDELASIKTELKCWESMFARKYQRRPTKDDIDESSPEIQDSYKRYAKLKSKEQTSKSPHAKENIKGGVFGQDLNKKASKPSTKKKACINLDSSSWRPKLKPWKRPSSATVNNDKVESNEVAEVEKIDLPDPKVAEKMCSKEENVVPMNEEVDSNMMLNMSNVLAKPVSASKSTNNTPVAKRKLGNNFNVKRRHSLLKTNDIDWLENCKQSLNNTDRTPASRGVRQTWSEADAACSHINNSGRKTEKEHFESAALTVNEATVEKVYSIDEIVKAKSKAGVGGDSGGIEPNKSEVNTKGRAELKSEALNDSDQARRNTDTAIPAAKNGIGKAAFDEGSRGCSSTGSFIGVNSRESKYKEAGGHAEDDFGGEDPDFHEPDEPPPPLPKTTKPKRAARKKKKKDEDDVGDQANDGPSTAAKPRKRKREAAADDAEDDEKSTKKMKVSKKSASSKGKKVLVSENFVKIDLRKKTYVRGLKKASASLLKRQAWRRKTAFEQPTKQPGKKICFKCGGEGHWAKFCRGRPKQVDLFKRLDEEKASLHYKSLSEQQGSCFDGLYDTENESDPSITAGSCNKFTMQDVMDITPCWPRTPYITEDNTDLIEPLVQPEDDEQPAEEAFAVAKKALKSFGFENFREGQHTAVARILSGLSTLVILATGAGKSLCYQLPAYIYYKKRGWMTIVVSPLVALMQDQVAGLPSYLPGVALNSSMTKLQQQKAITRIKDGQIAVLLVSPEALVSGGFGTGILPPKSSLPHIAFACIDEAHCLSEWSHNFRPSYLKVCKVLRERYQIRCLLGLTATASNKTAKSVIDHLGVSDAGSIIRDPNPIPPNLQLTSSRDDNRDAALVELLHDEPFAELESIIVYVTRRMDCDRLAVLLRTSLPEFVPKSKPSNAKKIKVNKSRSRKKDCDKPSWWNCESYHAGLSPAQRKRVQNQFMSGELRIVVATVAFGMGLDKSDVRSVIHYNMPKSFENYVQEIGRAGRDGKPSFCHVFLTDDVNDLCELKRHIYGDTIDRNTIQKFVDMLFPLCNCPNLYQTHKLKSTNEDADDNNFEMYQQEMDDDDMDLFFSEQPAQLGDTGSVVELDMEAIATGNDVEEDNQIIEGAAANSVDINKEGIVHDTSGSKVEDPETHVEKNRAMQDVTNEGYVLPTVNNEDNNNEASVSNTSKLDLDEDKKTVLLFEDCESKQNGDDVTVKRAGSAGESEEDDDDDRIENDLYAVHCTGHRRALAMDSTVTDLDVREEIISTLLAYLELHPRKWLRMLNPLRASCTVKCYGGPEQFQLLARKFPPVALAVRALSDEERRNLYERRQLEFDFVEVGDSMCWDVLTVMRELKSLQWNMSFALDAQLNTTGKSGIIIETEVLSFHFTTACGVGLQAKEDICDFLHEAVVSQEVTRLLQLDGLYCVLKELSCQNHRQIPTNRRIDVKARQQIGEFFLCKEAQQLDFLRSLVTSDLKIVTPLRRWTNISSDIRSLVHAYPDEKFTGRSVARIFQGIESPRYPAIHYGRDRRFWRQYIDVDFNELKSFAVRDLAKFL